MKTASLFRIIPLCAVAAVCAARLSADVIEIKNGARIVGTITKITGGSVSISTTFAGDLTVKQSEVTSIQTDQPVAVRLASGTRFDGQIATKDGAIVIAGADGTITTSVAKIAASWEAGGKDPAVAAMERHWKYEAAVDISGTNGNHNQLGTGGSFAAKLVSPQDSLDFYTAYNRQVTDKVKSADQFKAGIDYSSNFVERYSWFVRDEGGFDRIMSIKFYDTAAAGGGYDFVKNAVEVLTGRLGLAYRYDGYQNPGVPSVNSAAADLEFASDLKMKTWEMVNKLTVVPTFADFKNYIVTQDSYWQLPLANPSWKLRMGVSNNYQSVPPKGVKKLDTTYYTRLTLDWQ